MKNALIFAFCALSAVIASSSADAREWGEFTGEQTAAFQRLIQLSGYDCDSVLHIRDGFFSGVIVKCGASGDREYRYDLADKGGRWVVTPE